MREVAKPSREEARGEGSIEEWLGQVGLGKYGDLFYSLGITGDRTEFDNLDEAGMTAIVNSCVDEGGISRDLLRQDAQHLKESLIRLHQSLTSPESMVSTESAPTPNLFQSSTFGFSQICNFRKSF